MKFVCFFLQVFKHYFEELEEESLRDNFVVVVRILTRSILYHETLTQTPDMTPTSLIISVNNIIERNHIY